MRARLFVLALLSAGCSHIAISASELDRVNRPAFVARFESDDAGPHAHVFRDDSKWMDELRKKGAKMSASEADEKLTEHLAKGRTEHYKNGQSEFKATITRFEVADGIRATTLAMLPREQPWTSTVPPGAVSRTLESLLTEEVPIKAPDFELLRPLGVDAVVEIVVEDYGMRSDNGNAGCYLTGYGRMFMLDGGGNLWYRSFRADEVASGQEPLDPFAVNKDPRVFREHMSALAKAVAEQFAADLQPPRSGESKPRVLERKQQREETAPEQPQKSEDLP